ncbi:MAG: hypothetical protein NXI13_15035 [Proteobacteria bacterium]|nr:hypothetical protein [Pseudomonadota bacterium]
MQELRNTQPSRLQRNFGSIGEPFISKEHVQWAARRFILVYGDDAPDAALKQENRLDNLGKLQTAEMFAQVRHECARLLKQSEKLRDFTIN